jgi:hypothetical protein
VKKTDAGQLVIVGRAMNSPRDSAAALMAVLQDQPTEVFAILDHIISARGATTASRKGGL